jgi:hypothetical protein
MGGSSFGLAGEGNMNAIKGTVQNGRVSLEVPADWPEGCPVLIEPLPIPGGKIGLEESEWRDDPAALADWDAWLKTIEPLELAPDEEAAFARFDEAMRRYNLDAVRRQMEQGPLP